MRPEKPKTKPLTRAEGEARGREDKAAGNYCDPQRWAHAWGKNYAQFEEGYRLGHASGEGPSAHRAKLAELGERVLEILRQPPRAYPAQQAASQIFAVRHTARSLGLLDGKESA